MSRWANPYRGCDELRCCAVGARGIRDRMTTVRLSALARPPPPPPRVVPLLGPASNRASLVSGGPQQHDIRFGARKNVTFGARAAASVALLSRSDFECCVVESGTPWNPQQRHTRCWDPATTSHSVLGPRNNVTFGARAAASVALLSRSDFECCVVESGTPWNPQQHDTRRRDPATTRHSMLRPRNNVTLAAGTRNNATPMGFQSYRRRRGETGPHTVSTGHIWFARPTPRQGGVDPGHGKS